MAERKSFLKAVSHIGLWTLASRFLGLIRDSVVARFFGAGMATDAFMVAFRIPNLLRRLLAEGALSAAFVPVFADIFNRKGRKEFQESYQILFCAFSGFLVLVVLAGIAFAPILVRIFAPGFDSSKQDLAVTLARWMFPFIFFVGSSSVAVGVLNTLKSFSVPAASPLLLNIAMISCAVLLRFFFEIPIYALAWGVILGGLAQWILQLWKAQRLGFSPALKIRPAHPVVRKVFRLMAPTVFGVAVYHLNILVLQALASLLPEGSVTYLYYSDRFLEFPLGIFAISIATVALPKLSEDAAAKDLDRFKETLFFSLRLAAFICIPAMAGMMILRVPMLAGVFQYGKFSSQDTMQLAGIFLMASLGLCAVAGLRITAQASYSLGDVKTPVKAAFLSFLVNGSLGYLLMQVLGARGLTLSSSIAAWLQWFVLLRLLGRRLGGLDLGAFLRDIVPVILASVVMVLALWPSTLLNAWFFDQAALTRILCLAAYITAGGCIYAAAAYFFGFKEMRVLLARRFRKE